MDEIGDHGNFLDLVGTELGSEIRNHVIVVRAKDRMGAHRKFAGQTADRTCQFLHQRKGDFRLQLCDQLSYKNCTLPELGALDRA